MALTLRTQRPPVQVLPNSALLGKAVKLGGVTLYEVKNGAGIKKLEASLTKFSESGDGQGIAQWKLSAADAKAVAANPAKLKGMLFDALTGANQSEPSERAEWYEHGSSTEVKAIDRGKAFSALSKVFESDESAPSEHPDRAQLHAALRALLPGLLGTDAKVYRVVQHDNGSGFYSGVAALDLRRGTLKIVTNSWAP
jgi:hypothetical protein